ncbi:squalene synthase HpnD [Komagataeibacter nataicola]|uniref:Squalene synthase HpnD n=1 Tax=Komagataeibacter nataicola TaxID=265960 RepID=A0A9N7H0S7_9PROT|nr:presqualene diphosphate synthase HpnD [Komagataeibacter nataicola]AQU87569.1 squalene synthase HpnD [Komagataeibacter nataicola]PYD67062.1 squalene synthase HpnD [Komagataeibacter nataicola]WEQ55301.1 presqualene diphosphate synthase HpnD [Komagataeibacter nataicola]WNM09817.1 presqualene diphosphate synthase HpnD [Komagataeibacter nataicola]GBR18147.1 phytoene synthase [Komagataeibacter nataicola NRIC 0616]
MGFLRARHDEAPVLGCDAADLAEVEQIVVRSGTSFGKGMRILPPDRRYGMYAVYAFCRLVDDVADDEGEAEDKSRRLEEWRARITRLYAGEAHDGIDRVLMATIRRFDLRQDDFNAVIDGMEMDARGPIVAPDEATFDLYCDRVASAVGRLSVRVFGDSSPAADQVAYHLGRALQITNILRDVAEDARLGRLYLPRDLLERFGITPRPSAVVHAPQLEQVGRILAARAHDHFRAAAAAMAQCDRTAMRPARLMGATYAAILSAQERQGWGTPEKRVSLSRPRKVLIALRALAG